MRITCPKCSSSEARSLSLIHREGLTNTQGQTAGTSVGSLGGGLGVSTMRGTITAQSQTVLSKEAAPNLYLLGILNLNFLKMEHRYQFRNRPAGLLGSGPGAGRCQP